MKEMEGLLKKLLLVQLQNCGIFNEKKLILSKLKIENKIRDLYSPWLEESIKILENVGFLKFDGYAYTLAENLNIDTKEVWKEWDNNRDKWLKGQNTKAYASLVDVTLRALPEILTGKTPATDIMFPNSSMNLVEGIYKNNEVSDFFNKVLADALAAFIEERLKQNPKTKVKILEIGAGTGGTSEKVFQNLRPFKDHIQEYCYSDISKAFLLHAENTFGPDNHFLTYRIYNAELSSESQGIQEGSYDAVLATNVLHATSNIRNTLRNVKGLLKNNGLILLNEISCNTLLLHLTFGLLEGWWLYEDADLRIPGCPGLYPEVWKNVLEDEGFRHVFFPVKEAHTRGQQIIIAESDGIIRKRENLENKKVKQIATQSTNLTTAHEFKRDEKRAKVVQGKDVTEQMVNDYARMIIRESIAKSIKIDERKIQDDRSFSEYGVDSIIGVNLINSLNKCFNISINTTALFEYNNVNSLLKHIIKEFKPVIEGILEKSRPSQELHSEVEEEFDDENRNPDIRQIKRSVHKNRINKQEAPEEIIKDEPATAKRKKDSIAIIGISGRFAKSDTLDELWENLIQGSDLTEKVTRWDLSKHFSGDKSYCNYGSFINEIDKFDPGFFNISGLEATYMDPQQRIFLEESWKALEDAGYINDNLNEYSCGVFVGCVPGDYPNLFDDNAPAQAFWGNAGSVIPARISYFLNLKGPAVAIDTACSSSLVALHMACQSLRENEVNMALAGGVFIRTTEEFHLMCSRAGMLSPSGHCHTFDSAADGFVPGEGAGVIVLKRLEDALADGDHIYGVITGSAVNQDGATNGITAPNASSQESLERSVYDTFDINPEKIQMVEAHGTGTKLGDPIEFQALTKAFRHYTDKSNYCAIGSIKTNIGHTSTAAGIASVIKVLLSLKNKKIPPSIHFENCNPNIQFDQSPFFVNTQAIDWEANQGDKRMAAINSFGFGGTNAHVVIEEAPYTERVHSKKPAYLIVLSARTKEQLLIQAAQLLSHIEKNKNIDLGNMSYTLLTGRKHLKNRMACVVRDIDELVEFLTKWLEKGNIPQVHTSELHINEHKDQGLLKSFGNQCIENSLNTESVGEFLENYDLLAELYIQGYSLNFERLFSEDLYSRISLPTYPFERSSYWVKGNGKNYSHKDVKLVAEDSVDSTENIKPSTILNSHTEPGGIVLQPLDEEALYELEKNHNQIPCMVTLVQSDEILAENGKEASLEIEKVSVSLETLQKELVSSLADALYIKIGDVDIDKQFIDMGMDSIIAVEWINAVNNKYGVSIAVTKVYDYPTIREFSDFLIRKLGETDVAVSSGESYDKFKYSKPLQVDLSDTITFEDLPTDVSYGSMNLSVKEIKSSASIPISEYQMELAASLADALYIKQSDIDLDSQFIDLGMDSIIGVEWIKTINQKYGLSIAATKVYDYPTIREFSEFLVSELAKHNKTISVVLDERVEPSIPLQNAVNNNMIKMHQPEKAPKVELLNLDDEILNASENPVLPEIAATIEESLPMTLEVKSENKEKEVQNPEVLGTPAFRERYHCISNYYAGSMYCGVSSVKMVVTMGKSGYLSFLGSAGLAIDELERQMQSIQRELSSGQPYGVGLICNLNDPDEEKQQVELLLKYKVPVIEAAAYSSASAPLVYYRLKGLKKEGNKFIFPRRIIAKCSRLEVARMFMSPPPVEIVKALLNEGLISASEAELSQQIPLADDLAIEADSGGHTDQGVSFALIPSIISLKNEMVKQYKNQISIMVGCGGGIGTPEAVASAFMLGADFIFTGSINQCTVESGAHEVVKDMLSSITIHDTCITMAGDMFEIGSKIQVVKKNTQFAARANRLYRLFMQYNSIDEMPDAIRREIETKYFKKPISEVWDIICEYKKKKHPEQIAEANKNPRFKTALVYKWYFAHCSQVTLKGDVSEKDNFMIHCGPAMGAFNQWVRGTALEQWRNRKVSEIATLLMDKARDFIQKYDLPQTLQNRNTEDCAIAVIGMSGQFPKSKDIDMFWDNLKNGRDCISEIPSTRWPVEEYFDENPKAEGKTYSKWMGILEDIEKFDPQFFNILPVEAELMDPQQRLFLENCWRSIEDAGINPTSLSGSRCGVFVGCMTGDYANIAGNNGLNAHGMMGNSSSILSARISYLLNLKGPCLAIDTACSSSLVAIAEACNSLILGTSDLALAGGVCVLTGPSIHIMTSKAEMLSKDGKCFTFDQRANGFVPGEGVGVILLKRLSDAIRDNDSIYGVIRGWGVNQDGKTNGITAPSVLSQISLEKDVYERFSINPESISMIEAHGTGTKLGDPIEVEALTESFGAYTQKKNYCALGSSKSNIGHLLTASGIAGIIKVLLSIKHKMLPPTINFEQLNEHINLEESPFYINTKLQPWESVKDEPRRAAVSSFGFSGTNAHIVIEEYRTDNKDSLLGLVTPEEGPVLFTLSTKKEGLLKVYAKSILNWVFEQKELVLKDVAYTLQTGREAMRYRIAFVTDSREDLINTLQRFVDGDLVSKIFQGQVVKGERNKQGWNIDAEKDNVLDSIVQDGNLKLIAEHWVNGSIINWELLYKGTKPKTIHMPTYPFDKQTYWIAGRNQESRKMVYLKKSWKESNLCSEISEKCLHKRIAILYNEETKDLAAELSNHFPKGKTINISDITAELKKPEKFWESYNGCIDIVGCGNKESETYDWIEWLQRLVEYGDKDGMMLLCVTKGLEFFHNCSVNLSGALHAGLYRMLHSEYGYLTSRHMDVEAQTDNETLLKLVLEEFCLESNESEICYRGGNRYKTSFQEEQIKNVVSIADKAFPKDKVLLVTGGTRGIGFLCAEYLVKNYGVKYLVLTGREKFPPKEQWDLYIDDNTSLGQKIRNINSLEATGTEVEVLSLDLTDFEGVCSEVKRIHEKMGHIGGVIHAAGIYDAENPAFIRKKQDGLRKVLSPKVDGLNTLLKAFENQP